MVQSRRACDWKIVGVTKDLPVAQEIIAAGGVQYTNLVGKTTLAQLMDEICTSDVLLTNDTGTMHLAAHFGVPVVAIFGSTEPALTGPVGSGHAVLRHHVPCSPCFLRECPLDFRCMTAVTPEEAAAALQRIIDTRGGMPAHAAGH
jgi:ADP-heptose:LPS heptosyltransferase